MKISATHNGLELHDSLLSGAGFFSAVISVRKRTDDGTEILKRCRYRVFPVNPRFTLQYRHRAIMRAEKWALNYSETP